MNVKEILPPDFRDLLSGYRFEKDTLGKSGATVFLLKDESRPPLALKLEPSGPFADLPGEAARLRWLASRDLPCPRVLHCTDHAGRVWLLLEAIEGIDLASSRLPPAEHVAILAEALRRLHRLDPADCPFDRRLTATVAQAKARMEAGLVDEEDFDDERLCRGARELFEELLSKRPAVERLAVTHGDACLPNFIQKDGRFAGYIDCSRLGVADLHQDLALACRSITHNIGKEWVSPFLDQYGLPDPDAEKLAFYRLLDEFY